MRFVRIAIAAALLGYMELAFGWRIALSGAAPDLLFILAAFATLGMRPVDRIPVACCIGLLSDFLMGGRLGLMALSYGIGARTVEAFATMTARWGHIKSWRHLARGSAVAGATLVGSIVLNVLVAVLMALTGAPTPFSSMILRALGIALYTGAITPIVWPVLLITLGQSGGAWLGKSSIVEA